MAVKKVLISLGQSNSDPIGDDASWLLLHPNADLMSVSQVSAGKNDLFTMPGNFPGYSLLNLRGVAMPSVKYLTFYNPSATGYQQYPGTGIITVLSTNDSFGITPTISDSNHWVNQGSNPNNRSVIIKRMLTGTLHEVTGNIANGITVSPAFSPAPLLGEQFFFNLVLRANTAFPHTTLSFGVNWYDVRYGNVRGSLLGVKIRCTRSHNSNNEGVVRTIVGMASDSSVIIDSAFPHNPAAGDVYEFDFALDHIAGTTGPNQFPVSGPMSHADYFGDYYVTGAADGRFDKWGYFLPWCPLEGKIFEVNSPPKANPYAPGFNYPNDYSIPYWWKLLSSGAGQIGHNSAYHTGLAMRFRQSLGEEVYVINLGIGSTSLAQNEKGLGWDILSSPRRGAWIDGTAHSNWSPGASKSLYTRFLDILDTAVATATAQGDTLEVIGVFMSQGESDSAYAVWANAYEDNLRVFKSLVRKAIKNRGMFSGPVETIPWVQGKITTVPWGELAPTIRDAVQKLAYEDPYMGTFETDTFLKIPGDSAHFSGAGLTQWETAAFDVWEKVARVGTTDIDICNLALSHLGEGSKITSINPTDGSVQSSYCATFYPIARDSLLEMQQWNFAMRREALVEVPNTSTEYDFAYALPNNAAKIVSVLPPDAADDYSTTFAPSDGTYYTAPIVAAGMYNPQPYSIETNEDGEQVIYTDQPNAMVRYVYRTTDSRTFSQTFVVALSWHLASMLAGPVIKGDQGSAEAKRCQQMLAAYLGKAETHDATQRNIKPEQITPWISGR